MDQCDACTNNADAKPCQNYTSVEAISKPTNRNLKCEAAEHGCQHDEPNGSAVVTSLLHPRRNKLSLIHI